MKAALHHSTENPKKLRTRTQDVNPTVNGWRFNKQPRKTALLHCADLIHFMIMLLNRNQWNNGLSLDLGGHSQPIFCVMVCKSTCHMPVFYFILTKRCSLGCLIWVLRDSPTLFPNRHLFIVFIFSHKQLILCIWP